MGLQGLLLAGLGTEIKLFFSYGWDSILNIIISTFLFNLLKAILFIIQFTEDLFKSLAGISSIGFNGSTIGGTGSSSDLLFAFLTSSVVQNTFFAVLGFSIVMLVIFTIIAMVKAEFTIDTKTAAKGPILARSFKAILQFFIVPVFVLIGVVASNALTKVVYSFTTGGEQQSISATCFKVGGYNANRARTDKQFASFLIKGYHLGFNDRENNIFKECTTADKVADYIDAYMGVNSLEGVNVLCTDQKGFTINTAKFYRYTTEDANELLTSGKLSKNKVDYVTGSQNQGISGVSWLVGDGKYYFPWQTYLIGTPSEKDSSDIGNTPYRDNLLVNYFYDFKQFDFVLSIGSACVIAWTMLTLCLGLLKRAFEMVILFLMSPAVICMAPLDGGNAYNAWKKDIYSRLVAIIGPIFGFNVFFTLFPLMTSIKVFNVEATSGGIVLMSRLFSKPVRILMDIFLQTLCLIVGTGLLKSASTMLSNYLGVKDLLSEGSDVMGKVGGAVKRATMVTAGVAAGTAMTGRAVFHGTAALAKGIKTGFRKTGIGTEEKSKLKANRKELKGLESEMAALAGSPGADDPNSANYKKLRDLQSRASAIDAENAGLKNKLKSGDVHKKGTSTAQQDLESAQAAYAAELADPNSTPARLMAAKSRFNRAQKKVDKLPEKDAKYNAAHKEAAEKSFKNFANEKVLGKAKDIWKKTKETTGNFFIPKDKDGNASWGAVLSRFGAGFGGNDNPAMALLNLVGTRDGRKSLYQSEVEKKVADKAKEKKDKNDAAAAENDLYNKRKQAEKEEREKEAEAERLRAQEEHAQRIMDLVKQFYASKNLGDNDYAEYKGLLDKRKRAMEMGDSASVDNINADIKTFEAKHDLEVNAEKTKQDIVNNEDTQREFNAFKNALRAAAQEDAFKNMGIDDSEPINVTMGDEKVDADIKNTKEFSKEFGKQVKDDIINAVNDFSEKVNQGTESLLAALKKLE